MTTNNLRFSVRMSTELVVFLGKALPHRTSRIEAYTDLLNEQIKLLKFDFKGGCSVPFLVTILCQNEHGTGSLSWQGFASPHVPNRSIYRPA